jgi:glycosyltransferase involved in cell wall biosynthesis
VSSPPADRPRLLVLIKGLGIGGAERLISEGSSHWDRETFDYGVAYVVPWKDQLVAELTESGVEVVCVGGDRGTDLKTPLRLRELVRSWRPSLIHAHLPSSGIIARLATRLPVVYTEHNLVASYRLPTRVLNRLTYGRNRAVIAVSQAVAEGIKNYPGPTPRVIPNGVSLVVSDDEAAAARSELGLEPDDALIVHVGNIRPYKGHSVLIEAATRLASKRPKVHVVSIGGEKHPGDLDRVRAEARASGADQVIRFLGRRHDARAFIAAADIVVSPADVEGLPVSILEALALGRPVVATAVGGVPSVIVDGVTGRLVPPGNPYALAAALVETLDSPHAAEWGRKGAELVETNYGLEAMVAGYESVYREILGG